MTSKAEVKAITILGRRWFDKVNGNTYHTSQIMVDGVTVHTTPFSYGYGDHYVQSASEWLNANGYVKLGQYPNGNYKPLWQYCGDNGINFEYSHVDLPRKKDLMS